VGYRPPRYWWVLSSEGKRYPAKAIWAMAINDRPGNFNTKDACIGFAEHEFSLIDTRVTDAINASAMFDKEIERSIKDSRDNRQARLKTAPKKPGIAYTLTMHFIRNPDVVAEVLDRATGICEQCNKSAPFSRRVNGTPYLEVHHRTPLSEGGEDTVKNAIALCPNCHRKSHFG